MWQNLGRMYNVVDVLLGVPMHDLPLEYDPEIGRFPIKRDGEQETVNDHLDNSPSDEPSGDNAIEV